MQRSSGALLPLPSLPLWLSPPPNWLGRGPPFARAVRVACRGPQSADPGHCLRPGSAPCLPPPPPRVRSIVSCGILVGECVHPTGGPVLLPWPPPPDSSVSAGRFLSCPALPCVRRHFQARRVRFVFSAPHPLACPPLPSSGCPRQRDRIPGVFAITCTLHGVLVDMHCLAAL